MASPPRPPSPTRPDRDLTEPGLLPVKHPGPPAPEIAIWEVTRRCNFACVHCIVDAGGRTPGELDTEEAVDLLRQLAAMGVRSVALSGGEPFVRRDLVEVMRRGRELAPFRFSVASNGSLLRASVLEEMKGLGLETVQVSLDGATALQFSELRKGPPRAFELALAGVRTCREVGLPLSVGMFLHPGNIDAVPELVALLAREGVPLLRFSGFIPLGRGSRPEVQQAMRYEYDQMVRFFRYLGTYDPGATGVALAFDHAFGPTDDCFHCTAGERSFYVTAEGDVYPCPSFLHPDHRVGSLREQPLQALWDSPRMRGFRVPPEQIRGACAGCPDLESCGGGCRGTTYAYTGDVRESFPNCLRRYRRYLEENDPGALPQPVQVVRAGPLREALGHCYEEHARNLARVLEEHPLSYLLWQATLRCNLHCDHCAVPAEGWVRERELDTRQVKRMLEQFAHGFDVARIGALAISGGEPCLRTDLVEIVAHATRLGFRVGLDSNGVLLGRRPELLDRLVEAGMAMPCFSFDGLEATHEARRGPGTFRDLVAAMEHLGRRHPQVPLQTVTVVTRRNLHEVPRILDTLESLGVRFARFGTVVPVGRAVEDAEHFLEPRELRRLLRWIARTRSEGRSRTAVEFSCDGWCGRAGQGEGLEGLVREQVYNCPAGVSMATVYSDGRMGACLSLPDELSVQGSVLEEEPAVLWERGYRRFRDRSLYHRDACASCAEWRWCQGGAMHHRGPAGELLNCTWQALESAAREDGLE